MATVSGQNGFTQLTRLNVLDKLFVRGFDIANNNVILVKVASDLSGVLDSTKEYFIDGIIDMGTQSIEVPAGGLSLVGYNFNLSKLTSSEDNYTMFTSPVGGSGDLLGRDYAVEVTGASSKVYNIEDVDSSHAYEIARVNFNNCTSLGTIAKYRQGLEDGTGRFGGKPELTLDGAWSGGYLISVSIVRSLADGSYSLYSAGASFTMASRFKTNQNIDLPASASITDFASANFINPSTLQLEDCIITRAGVFNAGDANLTPNIAASDLKSAWRLNNGLENTFTGGELDVTVEVATTITTQNVYVDLAGTYVASDLQHFDSPSSGQLRHLGTSPREYKILGELVLDSTANNEIDLKAVVFRSASTTFEDGKIVRRVINNLAGGRDVAFYTYIANIILDENDYVKFQVANASSTANVTAELNSFFIVEER
tara:strand:+ start:23431 stop:24711 length:1281 start_codon:yes stop_codon:yes gene_type:complete